MYPEEILQMDNKECLVLIRGQKPLKGLKIIPDELSDYKRLRYSRVADYIPKWRKYEAEAEKEEPITENLPEEDTAAVVQEKEKVLKTVLQEEPKLEIKTDATVFVPDETEDFMSEQITPTTPEEILD